MIDPDCKICFDLGWGVKTILSGHGMRMAVGAGMPCECQAAFGLEEPDFSKVIEQSPTRKTQ